MPTTAEQTAKIKERNEQVSSLREEASGIEGTATTLYDNVMGAVRDDRAQRGLSMMAQDIGGTTEQLVTDPIGIKERTGAMVDPTTVDYLTSRQRGQNIGTLAEQSAQLKYNQGSIDESIQAGANQLLAMAQQKRAEAEIMAQKAAELRQEWEMDFAEREFADKKAARDAKGTGKETKEIMADFYEDLDGIRESIESGTLTEEEALRRLINLYPELTEEEIRLELGMVEEDTSVTTGEGNLPVQRINRTFRGAQDLTTPNPAEDPEGLIRNIARFLLGGKKYSKQDIAKMTPEERKEKGL
jgi:hypothetical protein